MTKSLLEQLPSIVAEGKREAERIMERLEGNYRVGLQTRELVIPSKDTAMQQLFRRVDADSEDVSPSAMNRLIYGDNLLAMAALLAGDDENPSMRGNVDLIYIDPPFDSRADYRTKVFLPGIDIEQKPTAIEQFAYSDMWSNGTSSYIHHMTSRLCLMREFLNNNGSIYIHLDWHVGHYMKVVLDELFGRDNFLNEIVWQKIKSVKAQTSGFGNVHDSIFFYSKGSGSYFKQIRVPHDPEYIKQMYKYTDDKGRKYRLDNFSQVGQGPARRFGDREIAPASGKHWIWGQERIDEAWEKGDIVISKNGIPSVKRYLDDVEGQAVSDIWIDINPIGSISSERTSYSTQKPESLLERIVTASCPENGIVADFFSGSGTTAAVAEKLGRRWITTDLGKPACMITRKRLIDQDAKPFLYQHVGDYQVEMARSTMGRKFRVGDLSEIVLGLYGALPLPSEENPNRNLGRIAQGKILIYVDSPNKMTGLATLKKAIELRNNHLGGWDSVVVLGWNFDPNIGHDIQGLNEGDSLKVLVIPPDLLDRIKKKGDKLKADEVRFSSLQYLVLGEVSRQRDDDKEKISVTLENYVLLSPEALNLDEANRDKLQKVINNDPLALIEYWSVDPDYDGEVFRSVWQDYRGNTENNDDSYRVVSQAELAGLPVVQGKRRICVRAVDVFGFEAEAIVEAEAAAGANPAKKGKAA